MRAFALSAMGALALLAIGSAIPTAASSISIPRSYVCTNAPSRVAGTAFDPRDLVPYKLRQSRGNPARTYWCAPNSETYVVFQSIITVAGPTIPSMLLNVFNQLSRRIQERGDGVVENGVYKWGPSRSGALVASFMNANNHQLTYGVVYSAVAAVRDYMVREGDYGLLSFDIWDGDNQVGTGVLGYKP